MKKKSHFKVSLAYFYLGFVVILALLAPLLANKKPLLAKSNKGWVFPFLNEGNYKQTAYNWQIKAPIPYSESSIDYQQNGAMSPFGHQSQKAWDGKHWLGTDQLGRDVLAQLIYGCRTAFFVGFGSMIIALILGLLIGGFSAYLGDGNLSYSWPEYLYYLLLVTLSAISLIVIPPYQVKGLEAVQLVMPILFILLLTAVLTFLGRLILKKYRTPKGKKFNLPLDLILNRLIELIDSLPGLLLVIALSAVIKGGIMSLIVIIGLTAWTSIAKLFRAEVLKVKNTPFISSAVGLGYSNSRILFKHLLPNALPSIIVALSFGISGAILAESSLSFLGLGISGEQASWGAMIASARADLNAWWVLLFPALAIFFTLLSCQTIGKSIQEKANTSNGLNT